MSLSLIYKWKWTEYCMGGGGGGGGGGFPYFVKMSRQSFRYHMALMTRIRILVASGSAIHDYDGRNNALGWCYLHCCWNYLGASMYTWGFPYFVKMSRQSFRYHMALMTRIRILVASGSAIHDYDGRNNALGWCYLHCCWNYLGASMYTWELIPRVLTSGLLSYLTGYKANIVQGIRSNQEYLFVVKLAGVVITQQCSNECMGFCLYEI